MAAAAGGCAAVDDVPAIVDIGVGEDRWRPLADGDPIDLDLGAQGSRHLIGNARIDGLWPGERDDGTDDPRVGFRVIDDAGAAWSADLRPIRRPFVPCAAGGFELEFPFRVYMVDGAEALDGQPVTMEVEVEDAYGVRSTDARRVLIRTAADH